MNRNDAVDIPHGRNVAESARPQDNELRQSMHGLCRNLFTMGLRCANIDTGPPSPPSIPSSFRPVLVFCFFGWLLRSAAPLYRPRGAVHSPVRRRGGWVFWGFACPPWLRKRPRTASRPLFCIGKFGRVGFYDYWPCEATFRNLSWFSSSG